MVYCEYGANDTFINVTNIVLTNFMANDVIHFNGGDKQFNVYFTDPCSGFEKILRIKVQDNVFTIPECDLDEHYVDLSYDEQYNYYKHLLKNAGSIKFCKEAADTRNANYYDLTIINNIMDVEISIVMTTYNRSIQTYFTLQTITNSINKSVQVIIVDDSTNDLLDTDKLKEYNLCIYHIKTKNKFWFNPCVNYNLGFQHIRGNKVIIQNAEVCHIGDIVSYVSKNLKNKQYFVFDVAALPDMHANECLYQKNLSFSNYSDFSGLFDKWYQHHENYSRQLHFLTAITKKDLNKLGGFDYDFSMGSWYDDNEFIFRIIASGINSINIPNDIKKIMGIHQWHITSDNDWDQNVIRNRELLETKKKYFDKNGNFFYLIDYNGTDVYKKITELFSS